MISTVQRAHQAKLGFDARSTGKFVVEFHLCRGDEHLGVGLRVVWTAPVLPVAEQWIDFGRFRVMPYATHAAWIEGGMTYVVSAEFEAGKAEPEDADLDQQTAEELCNRLCLWGGSDKRTVYVAACR